MIDITQSISITNQTYRNSRMGKLFSLNNFYLGGQPYTARLSFNNQHYKLNVVVVLMSVVIGWLGSDLKMISEYDNRLVLMEGSNGQSATFNHLTHLPLSLSLTYKHTHTVTVVANEGQWRFTAVLIGSLE